MLCHFAVACAEFDPARILGRLRRSGGVRRNANGACDLFAPVFIREKMLAKPLTRHTAEKCSRNARKREKTRKVARKGSRAPACNGATVLVVRLDVPMGVR